MKEREARLAHAVLINVLEYDPLTGVFLWKNPTSNRVRAGTIAGQIDRHGHRSINVCGTRYLAHRLAWFYMIREWPSDEIDHINLIKDDNRIANLREATRNENCRNVGRKKHNKSGFKGVCRHPQSTNKFMAQITVQGKPLYLGLYDDPEDASIAYVMASILNHGNFGRAS